MAGINNKYNPGLVYDCKTQKVNVSRELKSTHTPNQVLMKPADGNGEAVKLWADKAIYDRAPLDHYVPVDLEGACMTHYEGDEAPTLQADAVSRPGDEEYIPR